MAAAAFVGRTAELDGLVEAYGRASAGHGSVALVGGEAGVGKSRLVGEASAHARRQGARVLVGQCLDLEEGGRPYGPMVDVLRTLDRGVTGGEAAAALGPLRSLLGRGGDPGLPAAPGAGQLAQGRLYELLLTVIERLADAAPLVLVFEDLHWADRSTLELVSLLSSNTRSLPVLTIGTYRSEDVPPRHPLRMLAAELTRRGARHIVLDRLGAGEVAELLAALLPEPPPAELVASVVERSDGNPLFVEELAAALADDPAAPMPPYLRDAVISRVERLPADTSAVLRACAIGGREVEHDLLAEVAGLPPAALEAALRACVDHRLLVADRRRGGYRFWHALVHEAVLADTLPGELHRTHRSYADALVRRQADRAVPWDDDGWARLAHHHEGAGDFDAALAAAARAGRSAEAAFAVPEAHRCLEWSVRLWDRAVDPESAAACDRSRASPSVRRASPPAGRSPSTTPTAHPTPSPPPAAPSTRARWPVAARPPSRRPASPGPTTSPAGSTPAWPARSPSAERRHPIEETSDEHPHTRRAGGGRRADAGRGLRRRRPPPAASATDPAAAGVPVGDAVAARAADSALGEILVGQDGLALYGFTNDIDGTSTCADAWPPVLVGPDWTVGPGLDTGVFSTARCRGCQMPRRWASSSRW